MEDSLVAQNTKYVQLTEAEGGERVKFNSTFYTSSKEVKLGSARKQSITGVLWSREYHRGRAINEKRK
jgi:hypothetical protein